MASETLTEIVIAETPHELEFLHEFRAADDAGKHRLTKLLHATGRGLLPSLAEIEKMTADQSLAFVDALPEPPASA